MIQTWIKAFLKPKETFVQEKTNASIGKAILYIVIGSIIGGILGSIYSLLVSLVFGFGLFSLPVFVFTLIANIVLFPIASVIFSFISIGFFFIIAKLLGGKGNFSTLFYFVSLYFVPLTTIMYLLIFIPVIGVLFIFVLLLYSLYLFYHALKESQELSGGKAILAIIIPIIVLFVLSFVLFLLIGFAALAFFFQPSIA